MPLDLVGKLHRTVYIEGCPSALYEDLLRLLVAKCGAVEAWDLAGERLIVVFGSMNSVSTAITFNGTSFGDTTNKLQLWVATESGQPGAAQQLAICGGGGGDDKPGASAGRGLRNAREKRLAAIRAELTSGVVEGANDTKNVMGRRLDLCARQLRALCVLCDHELLAAEKRLEESTAHMQAARRLLKELREKEAAASATPTAPQSNVVA